MLVGVAGSEDSIAQIVLFDSFFLVAGDVELHDGIHLFGRAVPVFGAESV